jgi:hypothetical protein
VLPPPLTVAVNVTWSQTTAGVPEVATRRRARGKLASATPHASISVMREYGRQRIVTLTRMPSVVKALKADGALHQVVPADRSPASPNSRHRNPAP